MCVCVCVSGQTDVGIVSGVCLQARVSSCLRTHAKEVRNKSTGILPFGMFNEAFAIKLRNANAALQIL